MYQNVFYDKQNKIAHIWDDEKGHIQFPFSSYAFKRSEKGKYKSIFGDRLDKIHRFDRDDSTLFEADVAETTRILVDTYTDSDAVSTGHNVLFFDIEVEMESGLPDIEKPTNEITSIALYFSNEKKYKALVVDPTSDLDTIKIEHSNTELISCASEKDLLLRFLDIYEANRPTIITGWNCVDENAWVSTTNGLIQLKNITTNDATPEYGNVLNVWESSKPANKLTLANGKSILISDEHRIPVMTKPFDSYKSPSSLKKTIKDMTVADIADKLNDSDVYCKIPMIRNNQNTKEVYNPETLQLCGFIYTDGTYSKSKNDNRITITGIDYTAIEFYVNIINNNKLSTSPVKIKKLGKRKDHHSQEWSIRFTPSDIFNPYIGLIYDASKNKKLNMELLSCISEKEFAFFISGLIDGDGSIASKKTGVTICQTPIESKNRLYDLFSYFGIIPSITKSGVYIPAKKCYEWLFLSMNVKNQKRSEKIKSIKFYSQKNRTSNLIHEFTLDDCIIMKIQSIEKTDEVIKMRDIQTDGHYFTVGSIVVHNCDYFDIPYMYNRMKKVIGKQQALRLSPVHDEFYSPYRNRYFFAGVSVLDYLSLYKKFTYVQLPSYSLDSVSKKELGRGKIEYEGNLDELKKNDLKKFIEYNVVDVELIVELNEKLQLIDLVQGICHVGHVPYEDFVYSSKYLEGAVLTFLKRRNLVAPSKPADRKERMAAVRESGEEKFIGAYVKDPIVGKYEWIYDLDLTSLYPSIIMSLNISPETKVGKIDNWDAEEYIRGIDKEYIIAGNVVEKEKLQKFLDVYKYSVASNGVLYKTDSKGIIPSILDDWFDKRVEYKDLMKKYGKEGNNEQYVFYKQRQLVQKILLNSLYGVLGLPAFRFYDIDNAEAVTLTGQTVIKKTADVINQKYNQELLTENIDYNIYIDTDSCFFSALPLVKHRFPNIDITDDKLMTEKIYDIANESQEFVNKFYDVFSKRFFNIDVHRFEIKQEMIAKAGIWIAKKRYAQWIIADNGVMVDKLDVKGLDVVRSSFPKAFQGFMSNLLISILKGASKDTIDTLVLEMKNNVHKADIVDIAKNSSVNNLVKYKNKIDIDTINTFAKGTPAHVKAAIAYNRLLEHYKCPYKFMPFRDGDKMKWIYLKENPLYIDVLAFRGDSDPVEIKEFINKYADPDYMFTSELNNKLEDFYNALHWKLPSNNNKIVNNFFEF